MTPAGRVAPWVGGISLGLFVSGLASMRVGSAIERLGGLPVLGASSVLLAAGLALVAVTPSLPIYLAAWLVLGLGTAQASTTRRSPRLAACSAGARGARSPR